jgi:MOSC domain
MTLITKARFSGRVEQLLLGPDRSASLEKMALPRLELTFAGPVGDMHAGETRKSDVRTKVMYPRDIAIRNVRQLTLVSVEELQDVAERLGVSVVRPEWFGANLLLSGIPDFTLPPPSTRLQFSSGATVVVDLENYPCSQVAEVVGRHYPVAQNKVVKAAMHKRGVTAWVEREGAVATGDAITVFLPPNRLYPHWG